MIADDFFFPVEFIMTDWNVRCKSSQFEEGDEEMIGFAVKELLSWFYENYRRVKPLERKEG